MQLRWYQNEAVDAVWHYFTQHTGNPVVAMPTGTGKSVVIGKLVQNIVSSYPDQRLIKLTHRKELIEQNFDKLLSLWPLAPAGIYSAGLGRKEAGYPITYAGIGSVGRKPEMFGHINLVLVDECHLISPNENTLYQRFIKGLKHVNPYLKVIGFTATPYRLGQGRITDSGLFNDICYDLTSTDSFARLIGEGFLAPLVPKRPTAEFDVSRVATTGGDYNLTQLQAAVDRAEITNRALEEMLHYGADRKHWLVFASGIEHANHIAEELRQRGITAEAVHNKTSNRDAILRRFKHGATRAVVNNDVLTTGFDFPGIDLIGVLRPTQSPGLWVQMLGRGTRPCEGKENCLVLDYGGNTRRLGTIDEPMLPRAKGKKKGEAPVKCCEKCNTWNHARVQFCTCCGHEFTAHVRFGSEASELDLLSGSEAKFGIFAVDTVEYTRHEPRGYKGTLGEREERPPSVKITYNCGLRRFHEWLCLEHAGNRGGHKARLRWAEGSREAAPETITEALERIEELATPTHIKVWINKKYPEVMLRDYTGEAFGEKDNVTENVPDEDVPF